MSRISFSDNAWEDYLYWQTQDKKTIKKINALLKDIERNGHDGIGKSEPLTANLSGMWSKEIDKQNRLVYRITEDGTIDVDQCRTHYGNK